MSLIVSFDCESCENENCTGKELKPTVYKCDGYKHKQINADRIRSMKDEELAELLRDYQCNTCDFIGFCEETDKCEEEIFKWLKQENETN